VVLFTLTWGDIKHMKSGGNSGHGSIGDSSVEVVLLSITMVVYHGIQ